MITKTEIKKHLAGIRYTIANIASDGSKLVSLENEHDKIITGLDMKSRLIEEKKLRAAKKSYWRRAKRRMDRL